MQQEHVSIDSKCMQKIVNQVRMSFDTAGFFYIVMSTVWEKGIFKFGIAKNMKDRSRQYDSYTPGPVFVKKLYICKDMLAIEEAVKLRVGQYLLKNKLEWVKLPMDEIVKIFFEVTEIDPAFDGQVPAEFPVYRLSPGKLQESLEFAVSTIKNGFAYSKTFHRFMNTIQYRFEKIQRLGKIKSPKETKNEKIDIETDQEIDKKLVIVSKTIKSGKPMINYVTLNKTSAQDQTSIETTFKEIPGLEQEAQDEILDPGYKLIVKQNEPNIFKRLAFFTKI